MPYVDTERGILIKTAHGAAASTAQQRLEGGLGGWWAAQPSRPPAALRCSALVTAAPIGLLSLVRLAVNPYRVASTHTEGHVVECQHSPNVTALSSAILEVDRVAIDHSRGLLATRPMKQCANWLFCRTRAAVGSISTSHTANGVLRRRAWGNGNASSGAHWRSRRTELGRGGLWDGVGALGQLGGLSSAHVDPRSIL